MILTAGDPKNVINNTSVPINLAGGNAAPNSHLSEIDKLLKVLKSLPSIAGDAHVASILPESNTNSNDLSNVPVPSKVPENVPLNDSAATTLSAIVIPTTSESTTSTTSKPTTPTTSKPTTPTTTKPTTPTTTTSTTSTTKPTTTPIPSTTTPTPTPLPPPSIGTWKVQENNTFCIIVQMAAQFNISYINANNKVSILNLQYMYM